jgi:hypothetical protein
VSINEHLTITAVAPPPVRWPHINALLASAGHITIGHIAPIKGAAIAASEHALLATVVSRLNEPFEALLERLDRAVGQALNEGVYTNEIEGGHFMLATPEALKREKKLRKK